MNYHGVVCASTIYARLRGKTRGKERIMLKLMYITNRPEIARIAEAAGVDRIFVDMEYLGKDARQRGLDTVKSRHTVRDARAVKAALSAADLLVRVNPIHDAFSGIPSSREEIDAAVEAGADILMLPYFKTVGEVRTFLELVDGRVKTMLLFETPEAVTLADEILALPGIDEIHIGLNDLNIGYGQPFLFQPLADGTLDLLCPKFRARDIPFGFGGIARLGGGAVPAEIIIREHCRLGSQRAILSRSFCNTDKTTDLAEIEAIFRTGLTELRQFEAAFDRTPEALAENHAELRRRVADVVRKMEEGQ